jgi:hypothetical protein
LQAKRPPAQPERLEAETCTGTKRNVTGAARNRDPHGPPDAKGSSVPTACVIVRSDGIPQILHTRTRDLTEPYPESIAALLAVTGAYVSALLPASTAVVLVTTCLAIELGRAYKARRLLCQPIAEVLELPTRRRTW